jgi:hypothetical protein
MGDFPPHFVFAKQYQSVVQSIGGADESAIPDNFEYLAHDEKLGTVRHARHRGPLERLDRLSGSMDCTIDSRSAKSASQEEVTRGHKLPPTLRTW